MSKSFSHSSLSRDLNREMPSHHRRDSSGMGLLSASQSLNLTSGLGRMSQGSGRLSSLMNLGSMSKLSQQGSHGMLSTSSSSQSLPSIFSLGNRPAPPLSSQPRGEPDQASKILASFGLSSRDLDELSRYPEEKITPENLPQIIQHLKRRRSENMAMLSLRERSSREPLRASSDDWDDTRPFRRENFNDRSSGLDPVVDYDHGNRSRDPAYRDRLEFEDRLRDRERLREDRFLSDSSYRKLDNDYEPMGYNQLQERSVFEKTRGMPSNRNIDDFHGLSPKDYPHLCSLCDIPIHSKQNWNDHIGGRAHRRQRLLLLEIYPEWNGHGLGDSFMLQQSTNPAPGILGPPPPAGMHMGGGPGGRHGGQRGHLGNEDMPGPRHMLKRPGIGRVVHVMDFERGKNLKYELLKLAEPFGIITNHLVLNRRNEAFIEMSTPQDAMAVVDYFSTNPATVLGQDVRVHLSQKYKRIKKPDGRPEYKPEPKPEVGRVIHLSNLPHSGYSDTAVIKLAEAYGKVKTYILMRMKNQAFIEMEKPEDANTMVERCSKIPLLFQGKTVKVDLSERYKKLVLRIPNKNLEQLNQKGKPRKRTHSPDQKNGTKEKQSKAESSQKAESSDGENKSQMVTTEEADLEETDQKDIVTDSCEPELVEEDETAALMETSSSVGDDAEIADLSEVDPNDPGEEQAEAQGPSSSTPIARVTDEKKKRAHRYHGDFDDFVTLDEIGDEEDPGSHKLKSNAAEASADKTGKRESSSFMTSTSVEEAEQENEAVTQQDSEVDKKISETSESADSQMAPESENAAETSVPEIEFSKDLGPYKANNPVGVEYVVPKTGFYCKLCSLFYTTEDVAKVTHCSSLSHYQKLKKVMKKISKNPEKKN
ncbi:matrin-3 isoform X2 [Pseudophryne corroboree]|uniref:matrin-3 isoform X2 n=1 Tax=Pseudophryne corroboree TaxID=495146 RepID=UPI003081AC78